MVLCPNCEAELRDQARFCPKCGTRLVSDSIGPTPPPSTPPILGEENPGDDLSAPGTSLGETLISSRGTTSVSGSSQPDAVVLDVIPSEGMTPVNDSSQADAAAPGEMASEETTPATGSTWVNLSLRVGKEAVVEQRSVIAAELLKLIPLVGEEHREKNKALFEKNAFQPSSIEDQSWGQMAFVTGMYGHIMRESPLTAEQRQALWQALVWAVQYEYYFRPKFFTDRFLKLAEFLSGCAEDEDFRVAALEDIGLLLFEFDNANLKKVRDGLAKLPASFVITTLGQMVDKYAEIIELKPVLSAIERLWWLLDSRREEQNQQTMAEAHQKRPTPLLLQRLATMGVIICQNALSRMRNASNSLADEQLQAALILAEFATRNTTGDYAVDSQKCHFLLKALQGMRSGNFDPTSFAEELKQKFNGRRKDGSGTPIWPDLMALVRRSLAERRDTKILAPIEAEKWVQVFAGIDGLNESELFNLQTEARLHGYEPKKGQSGENTESPDSPIEEKFEKSGSPLPEEGEKRDPLDFLMKDQRAKLLESIRNLRLDQMRVILRRARKPLLSALSKVLCDPSFDEIRSPRRSLHIRGNNGYDLFPSAKTRVLSPDQDSQRRALRLFEQVARETMDKENAAVAREWSLFAQARVYGLHRAISSWKEDYSRDVASWEEIWNLAVASVRVQDVFQALDVLKPGVKEQNAPFPHLRFALYCGVQVLQQSDNFSKVRVAIAMAFLLDHLTQLPLPECYLAWLLLANEAQEPVDYNRQLYFLNVFQDILERPIKILQPEDQSEEVTIEDFEKDLQSLLTIIRRLEENYILEPQEDRIGIRSKMLATFLRTPQLIPQRVGLFVDYENLLPLLPSELKMRPKEVGDILVRHASQYGEVVCRWACVDPRKIQHIIDPDEMQAGFEEAGFQVQFPRGETGILIPKDNLTDFVLVERITFETIHSNPDVYIIVSGDRDYYERIMGLLEEGSTVRLVASTSDKHLAFKYRKLEKKSRRSQLPESYPGDFFIDNLDKILPVALPSRS